MLKEHIKNLNLRFRSIEQQVKILYEKTFGELPKDTKVDFKTILKQLVKENAKNPFVNSKMSNQVQSYDLL